MKHRNRWIIAASLLVAVAAAGIYALLRPERCEIDANGKIDCPLRVLYARSQDASDWSVNLAALLPGIDKCTTSYSTNYSRETIAITRA